MNKTISFFLLMAILIQTSLTQAALIPRKLAADRHIQTVTYDPNNVVIIQGHYGYQTQVVLGHDETIQTVSIGDSLAWQHARKTTDKTEFSVEEAYTLPKTEPEQIKAYPILEKPAEKNLSEQQIAVLQAKQKELQQRLSSPVMLFNAENNHPPNTVVEKSLEKNFVTDPNTQFLQQASNISDKSVHATRIGSLNQLIAQGQLFHAILETAINSDLPGSLRAIIDQPIYAEDGSQILIPPGSRLIGQYKSGMLQGQSRVFVVWIRLITPDGVSLDLASPGVDALGMAGMSADTIDRHFRQQFGTAALLSIVGAGTSNVGVTSNTPYNASQAYRMAVTNSLNQTAQQTLQRDMISSTLWINQGSPLQVFVAHDLDFSTVHQ